MCVTTLRRLQLLGRYLAVSGAVSHWYSLSPTCTYDCVTITLTARS